jgi:hypothetical protein
MLFFVVFCCVLLISQHVNARFFLNYPSKPHKLKVISALIAGPYLASVPLPPYRWEAVHTVSVLGGIHVAE